MLCRMTTKGGDSNSVVKDKGEPHPQGFVEGEDEGGVRVYFYHPSKTLTLIEG